jgi:biotin carboxyl carrier protein
LNKYKTTYEIENLSTIEDELLDNTDIKIISQEGNVIRLLYNNKSYQLLVKRFDPEKKEAKINVDGYDFEVKVKEPLDHLINELGFLKASKHSVKEIKSPMPGLVVNIFVEIGQTVNEGDKLLSLEAMKMENILKAPGDGIIKSILINKGNSVDKNQVLIAFE